ncbi:uncharacterized protein [Ranitomeya imitator]|uniref:uncharacterized protein n=1 Tax=Ranitomeya imitator TaxID=111125 RepID=UPI0037E914EC
MSGSGEKPDLSHPVGIRFVRFSIRFLTDPVSKNAPGRLQNVIGPLKTTYTVFLQPISHRLERSKCLERKMDVVIAKILQNNVDFIVEANHLKAIVPEKERERQRIRLLRRRRLWIHPITAQRMTRGVFSTLHMELRGNPEKFFSYVRMKAENFDLLVDQTEHLIRRSDTNCRFSISPAERLMVTLRFLATGESLSSLHFQFRLGISTISGIVKHTCRALWVSLHNEFIPHPTMENWLEVAGKFQQVFQFPSWARWTGNISVS